uniref:EF-hand domain-containing protein n=2 Tax=Kalanchoe fedtschenkoi TaxID=63787 RepID=A0A7N0TA54_KALFE
MRPFLYPPPPHPHFPPSLLLIFTLFISSTSRRATATSQMVSSAVDSESAGVPRIETPGAPSSISCTTFNILAPIYKHLDCENDSVRESDYRDIWLDRNQRILDWLLKERSSIICLQELWVGNDEFGSMYLTQLKSAGYVNFKLARTNNRGDGLLTSVHQDYFKVINHRELLFNDFGDRVAQLLHVLSLVPLSQNLGDLHQEIIIVNTHLLFPHDSSLSVTRIHEAYKILMYLERYQRDNTSSPATVILCGDWNGSKRGHVYKFLRSQGFESSYDVAHNYSDSDDDAHKWVSHRNHRGNICGVDFIWLLNPDKIRNPLKNSWADAVLGLVKYQLQKALLDKRGAFALFKVDSHGDLVTYSGFYEALRQINLIGHPYGLSPEEVKDLWKQADVDGNGVIDYDEFQHKIWNLSKHMIEEFRQESERKLGLDKLEKEAIGLKVENAVFYPRCVEEGTWPED